MISIKDFKRIDKGNLKASFSIYLPDYDMTVRDCTYMQKDNQSWINFPSRMYEKDGEKKYFPYVRFGNEIYATIQKEALKKVEELLESDFDGEVPF